MREDRLVALRVLGASERPAREQAVIDAAGDVATLDVSERGGGSPAELDPTKRETERAERVRLNGYSGSGTKYATYRLKFAKVGRAAFLGHLDLVRLLSRSFRRADLPLSVTRGFSPKPRITFGPALGLGIPSLGELCDVDLDHAVPGKHAWEIEEGDVRVELEASEVFERLAAVCPPGIELISCEMVRLNGHPLVTSNQVAPVPGLGKAIDAVDVLVRPAPDGMVFDRARLSRIAEVFLAKSSAIVMRGDKHVDVRVLVHEVDVIDDEAAAKLAAALDWPAGALLRIRVSATSDGSAKPAEIAKALGVWGLEDPRAEHALLARLGVVKAAERGQVARRVASLPVVADA
jgi:radical SAM-linked protein